MSTIRCPLWTIAVGAAVVRGLIVLILMLRGHAPEIFEYEVIASNLLNGHGLVLVHHGQPYQAYHSALPYVLVNAAVCGLTRHRHVFLLAVQAVVTSILVVVVARIGTRVFDARTGLIAAVLTALHPGLLYYDTHKLHPLGVDALLIAAAVLAYMKLDAGTRWISRLAVGALAGLALMERGSMIAFAAVATVIVSLAHTRRTLAALRFAVPLACGIALILGTWVARNAIVLGTPVAMTSAGENFWRGNKVGATGTALAVDGTTSIFETSEPAFQAQILRLDEVGQNRAFWREAMRFWRESPGAALWLYLRKLYYFFAFSPTAGALYAGWMFLAYVIYYVLELIAISIGARDFATRASSMPSTSALPHWLPVIAIISVGAVQSAFYVETRHRWGVEPLMLVFAARGVRAAMPSMSASDRPR